MATSKQALFALLAGVLFTLLWPLATALYDPYFGFLPGKITERFLWFWSIGVPWWYRPAEFVVVFCLVLFVYAAPSVRRVLISFVLGIFCQVAIFGASFSTANQGFPLPGLQAIVPANQQPGWSFGPAGSTISVSPMFYFAPVVASLAALLVAAYFHATRWAKNNQRPQEGQLNSQA